MVILAKKNHIELVTNAWVKLYEILEKTDILSHSIDGQASVQSVHLCECPGGFVCATNHYLKSLDENVHFDWRAISLNPYYEGNNPFTMINHDDLYQFTAQHWINGADDTGNIISKKNIEHIWNRTSRHPSPWKIDFVTADGSVPVQHDPSNQEILTAPLHFAELICALGLLKIKGSLVLKMFTFFEHHSLSILAIMSMLFEQVTIVKPRTSKPGNSEVYVLGFNFQGVRSVLLKKLTSLVKENLSEDFSIIPKEWIPLDFIGEVIDCSAYFSENQISTISENLRLWERGFTDVEIEELKSKKRVTAQAFIEELRIKAIRMHCMIAPQMVSLHKQKAFENLEIGSHLTDRRNKWDTYIALQEKRKKRWNFDTMEICLKLENGTSLESDRCDIQMDTLKPQPLDTDTYTSSVFSTYSLLHKKSDDSTSVSHESHDTFRRLRKRLSEQNFTKEKWILFSDPQGQLTMNKEKGI
ncbi:ribosomal Rna large subunit methyltransferase J protein [Cardiosporidium cionae]|uniref:Cap-specific mRNA (nucleoside-2'-O-)-methyltransferase 2 n=1 Tax=Cardiosporidium cionae TaxID=476202 RepID=A0ABQ7JE90_9APIC|nr:ribosomal Rna large subunit methyltransferase J protein [Cardiosporidium cionae]|eukprot:KAF8821965.1 ribosomal Rna large subunit methyltransferase J protein [Cardiosporidium cionae]